MFVCLSRTSLSLDIRSLKYFVLFLQIKRKSTDDTFEGNSPRPCCRHGEPQSGLTRGSQKYYPALEIRRSRGQPGQQTLESGSLASTEANWAGGAETQDSLVDTKQGQLYTEHKPLGTSNKFYISLHTLIHLIILTIHNGSVDLAKYLQLLSLYCVCCVVTCKTHLHFRLSI